MKLSKKRTCEGCRAYCDVESCTLRYNNEGKYDRKLYMHETVPQEPCLKPKTYAELIEAGRIVRGEK